MRHPGTCAYTGHMTTNPLHAHVSTDSADCDGRYSRTYVETPTEAERADDFSDLVFKERVLAAYVSVVPGIVVKVEVTMDGFTAAETTDEGYRHVEVEWCEYEECDDAPTYRDHRAESMGY